jgi:hypothetical protein
MSSPRRRIETDVSRSRAAVLYARLPELNLLTGVLLLVQVMKYAQSQKIYEEARKH